MKMIKMMIAASIAMNATWALAATCTATADGKRAVKEKRAQQVATLLNKTGSPQTTPAGKSTTTN